MKKNLVLGIAALAIFAGFTSCSHDVDSFGSIGDLKNEQYTASFTARYGTIDSNNDWGFGSIKATRAAVAGRTNAYTSTTTFPSTPDASVYAESVPEGITYLGNLRDPWGGYQLYHFDMPNKTVWLDAAAIVNCGMKFDRYEGYTIYVKGEVVATDFYLTKDSKLYLTKGAKLTLQGTDFSFGQENTQIYVADGAELICNGELQFSRSKLFNNGKVTAKSINVAMTGMIYNSAKGLIDVEGVMGFNNVESMVVNDGKIEADHLGTQGSSKFMNNGTTDLVGDTEISSNNNVWVNNGTYITENFTYTAGSAEVINNCKLIVRDKFFIGLANTTTNGFRLDGSVQTKDFVAQGPGNIFMTSNSVFKVSNEAKMNITVQGNGIYGPASGDYAVFQAKDIVWGGKNNYCVSYFNNLYVVADNHFEHAYLGGPGNCPTYYYDPPVKVYANGTKPNYSIAESECNPGFDGDKDEIPYAVRIICEDLGAADDFDFNDVVFDALIKDNKTYIRVMAAGGTLPLYVAGTEVHSLFGVDTKVMINTGKNAHNQYTAKEFVINQAYPSYKDIPVQVELTDATASTNPILQELKAERGAAPQKIAVDIHFVWCDERDQIETVYETFPTYVNNSATLWQ